MRQRFAVLGMMLSLATSGAFAQPGVPALDRGMPGPRTQVLVLGSTHLSQLPETFSLDALQPVLDRLAAFAPDIITVESIPGEQCDLLARHPTIYPPEDIAPFCKSTAPALAATGLDVPAAIAQAHAALRQWPAQPSPAQRRHLAALFLAAGDDESALVQWLQLPAEERRTGDGLDAALVAQLHKQAGSRNESYSIGAALAARLGLQRIHAVDDHTGDAVALPDSQRYGEAVMQAWKNGAATVKADRERVRHLSESGDMLALYRFVNRADVLRRAVEGDFGAALREPSAEGYGRMYVGGWETRNLRMVANIRAAFRERPGARVLVIVGSSHKPWFDGLLGQLQGVELVDAAKWLK